MTESRGPRRAARPPRARAGHGERARDRVGARARQHGGLGQPRGARRARRRRRAGRRVRGLGAARAGADAPARAVSLAHLHASNVALLCLSAALFTGVFFYAQLLQIGLGYGPLAAGLRLMPWTATLIAIAPWAGALTDRIGARPLMALGLALQAAGTAWLALAAEPGGATRALLAPLILSGIGCSLAIPAAQAAAVGAVAPAQIGKAAGVTSTMRILGGVLGIAVAVAVFSASAATPRRTTSWPGSAPPRRRRRAGADRRGRRAPAPRRRPAGVLHPALKEA